MAHLSIIFGYIEGSPYYTEYPKAYRTLQEHNTKVIHSLPEKDSYPALSMGMFHTPDLNNGTVVFRHQVITFGSSISGIEFGDIPEWIEKFEALLARLFWYEAEVHIKTDIRGILRLSWKADDSIHSYYHKGDPQPTTIWRRTQFGDNFDEFL
jgi:hypothetical protein